MPASTRAVGKDTKLVSIHALSGATLLATY